MKCAIIAVAVSLVLGAVCHAAAKKPLKVFILSGQSNMEGPASIKTFDYIGDDPATAPILKEMVAADGKPVVCEHAWLSYLTGGGAKNAEFTGKMTAGYGSMGKVQDPSKPGEKIGPEFTFAIYMSKALNEPFLIIKTAWGGKSLSTDFRPPSAGPYVFPEPAKNAKARTDEEKKKKAEATGLYYRYMIEHVKSVLKDIKRVCPEYEGQGYEIAGFVWLQGWNDVVDHSTYQGTDYSKYGEWMADFIRDVRKDLNAPEMPFVIGVMGQGGATKNMEPRYAPLHAAFREAQASPSAMPEFKGRVIAVRTEMFWDEKLRLIDEKRGKVHGKKSELDKQVKDGKMTKAEADKQVKEFEEKLITPEDKAAWSRGVSNAEFHYLGCAKIFAQMGKAFAEAILNLGK